MHPDEQQRVAESREARKLASVVRRTTTRNRVRACSTAVAPGSFAEVSIDEDGSATISNLMRCGRWLASPICAAVTRSRIRAEIERAVDEWTPHGGGLLSLAEMGELMELARAGRVDPIPYATRPMAEAESSLRDLEAGSVVGRIILTA